MTVVVAEAGQCHGGSVKTALEMVESAAQAGAWAVKWQLLEPDKIARADAPKYWYEDGLPTTTQREAFALAGMLKPSEWREVKDACDAFGVEFIATPFDLDAVDTLQDLGVRWIKIASGDITFQQLLERVNVTGCRVMLSTGASSLGEVDRALGWLRDADVTLLACTLSYPTQVEAAHLARITTLRDQFLRPVGYSDHTSNPYTALGAAVLGATCLEVHFTLDNNLPDVPDHKIAVDPSRLRTYVEKAKLGAALRGSGMMAVAPEEMLARSGARRSVCAAHDLAVGDVLGWGDFVFLRPGDGLPPSYAGRMVGKAVRVASKQGELLLPVV